MTRHQISARRYEGDNDTINRLIDASPVNQAIWFVNGHIGIRCIFMPFDATDKDAIDEYLTRWPVAKKEKKRTKDLALGDIRA